MTKWHGKSKGTVLGYKIFVFFIKNFGVRSAYVILYFVAFYYFLFLKSSNKVSYYYFRNRLGYSYIKSKISIYKHYLVFGKIIIDKTAISAGLRNQFTYEFDGIEILKELSKEKKGGILLSAHVGNFEIAEFFFSEVDLDFQINLVTTDLEHNAIKNYLESISTRKPSVKFIIVSEDMSHIFQINDALSNNELICFTGDRYFEGSKFIETEFLGETAKFPAGPFLIASRLKAPVVFVYVMKQTNKHYHLYARKSEAKHRDEKELVKSYVDSVESILKKYPLQWFNFFDFWEKLKS